MRKLATIREISNIRPIEGADKIVVAQVDGWECVVQKDEFQIGQHIVYIEVDSIVPERPEFEFLRPRKFRLALRKQVYTESQATMNYNQCSADMTQLKKSLEWLREVDATALQSSLQMLDTAYQNFFRRLKQGHGIRYLPDI